jgi:pimeloyl-ACP methyl ester carboxylesterase
MDTYALIHGAADTGWSWHLVAAELRQRGHDVVAVDLPCEDDSAGLPEYADAVTEAVGARTGLVLVAHSCGGFTAPVGPRGRGAAARTGPVRDSGLGALAACAVAGRTDAVPALPRRSHVSRPVPAPGGAGALGVNADEIDGSHCVALSRPKELAERLESFRLGVPGEP